MGDSPGQDVSSSSGDWSAAALDKAWTRPLPARHADEPDRRLWLGMPDGPAPKEGFPLVLVLDGADYFTAMLDTSRRLCRRPGATGVAPAIIVGIDTAETGAARVARRRGDYIWTPPADPAETPPGARPPSGAAFLDRLEGVLADLPDLPIDRGAVSLFGHSIAGNFVLHALAARPGPFSAFGSISPSLWWNPAATAASLAAADLSGIRLLLGVGEKEEGVAARVHAGPRRMVANAEDLARQLSPRLAPENFSFAVFPDEDHGSVVSIAMVRFLRMATPAQGG